MKPSDLGPSCRARAATHKQSPPHPTPPTTLSLSKYSPIAPDTSPKTLRNTTQNTAMMLTLRSNSATRSAAAATPSRTTAVPTTTTSLRCRSMPVDMALVLARAGDVEAPIAVPIVAAIVVTAAITFAVPAYLNRGQQAADQIFSSKQNKPLDKKAGGKTAAGKGKTTGSKRR